MIVLEADADVLCHVVHADLAEASEVPYILPVLEHVRERGGAADAGTLAREMFMTLPVARSLLGFCTENGLADRDEETGRCAITGEGEEALESGRVFVRRRGMWKVHCADHEMVPEDMQVVMIGDGSREAGFQPGMEWNEQPRVEGLPDRILQIEGKTLRPLLGSRRGEAVLHRMHGRGKQAEPNLRLRLRVVPGADGSKVSLLAQPSLKGGRAEHRAAAPGEIALPDAPITYGEVVGLLAGGDDDAEWDVEKGRLLVRYGDASGEERASMKRTLSPRRIRIGLTEFEPAGRAVVDIFPAREEDAKMWARDVLVRMADDYLTRGAYDSLAAKVRARFEGFEIDLGRRTDHLPGGPPSGWGDGERRLFWLITAMEDWDL